MFVLLIAVKTRSRSEWAVHCKEIVLQLYESLLRIDLQMCVTEINFILRGLHIKHLNPKIQSMMIVTSSEIGNF